MFARLRWSAFGLRGRIVGTVLVTTVVTLGVAALVLLPRLESVLETASKSSLKFEIKGAHTSLQRLSQIDYSYVPLISSSNREVRQLALRTVNRLEAVEQQLSAQLGNAAVTLYGSVDKYGTGHPIGGRSSPNQPATAIQPVSDASDVATAATLRRTVFGFGNSGGSQVVRAAIWLGPSADAVLAVRSSIGEIPNAVAAVRRAFEIAAAAAILMTLVIAIPLAGTLVSRLRRLRQAALHLAIDGSGRAGFPVDRARDEVGDLARSFSIMQRRLRQQEEARRAFVATASHELRTPLASLEGMLELLADDLQAEQFDLDDANALLDRARAQSRRLARLAADLLDLSRIDADVPLRSEPVELCELARAVAAEFDVSNGERGVSTVLQEQQAPAWALADPGSVARILRILLDNALRVAPAGSEVRLIVSAAPAPAVSVIDNGPGVAPEERALIFDRFKRGTETGGEAGFGLGLAIGRELAQRMGGTLVLADTERPGATFTLTLRPTGAPSTELLDSTVSV